VRANFVVSALLAAWLISGCTTQQAYSTAQAWQRNQCGKLPDKADFDRCMSQTQTTYESYKQQTEPIQR
jgi:hypothetical protein